MHTYSLYISTPNMHVDTNMGKPSWARALQQLKELNAQPIKVLAKARPPLEDIWMCSPVWPNDSQFCNASHLALL